MARRQDLRSSQPRKRISGRRRRELALIFALVFGAARGQSLAALTVPFVTPPAISVSADSPRSAVAADLDGDGDLDVVSASSIDDTVAWFENMGNGSFGPLQTISVSVNAPYSVVAADLDGDGDLDVLSASGLDNRIAWFENFDGQGSFGSLQNISTTIGSAIDVIAADLDGDGDLDVAAAAFGGDDIVWFRNTALTWAQQTVSSVADGAHAVFAADLDEDGDLDLVSASTLDSKIAWYENTSGAGAFSGQKVIPQSGSGARDVFVGDFDQDGDPDILSAHEGNDRILLHLNNGSASFGITRSISLTADGAVSVSGADVDGDGDLDVVAASKNDSEVAWFENDGSGQFGSAQVVSTSALSPRSVEGGDLDGDGDLDLLVAAAGDEIAWHRNDTIHRSAVFDDSFLVASTNPVYSLAAADLDGDGDVDVVTPTSDGGGGRVEWQENQDGAGGSWVSHLVATIDGSVTSVSVADVDADGDADLVTSSFLGQQVDWYENAVGDGSAWTPRSVGTTTARPSASVAADVDGDGDVDVLSSILSSGPILWFENVFGDGSSWTPDTLVEISGSSRLVSADVDGDGDVDAISSRFGAAEWHENVLGDGSSWAAQVIASGLPYSYTLVAADVDGDGDVDAFSASNGYDDNTIAWFENLNGDGSAWARSTIAGETPFIAELTAADLDGDGDVDVIVAFGIRDDLVLWFENVNGDGDSWATRTIDGDAPRVGSLAVADVDRDGDLDAISGPGRGGDLSWYENRGGQLALPTTALAQGVLGDSQEDAVFQIDLEHRGRAGDSDVELASLRFRFEDGSDEPLLSSEADALIDKLEIFLDDGSGVFESSSDTLVEMVGAFDLVGGVETIPLSRDDPSFQVAFGETKRLFAVITLSSTAGVQSPDAFEVFHLTEDSSAGRDASAPSIVLELELQANGTTGAIHTDLETPGTCRAPFELELSGFDISSPVLCEAGTVLAATDVVVTPSGVLTLRAGERVQLGTDVGVDPGGRLRLRTDSTLLPP